MAHKVYCYVDESGQDTRGDFFVVAVVVVDALCGLVRAAYEEQPEMLVVFEKARRSGIIKDLYTQ